MSIEDALILIDKRVAEECTVSVTRKRCLEDNEEDNDASKKQRIGMTSDLHDNTNSTSGNSTSASSETSEASTD